MSDWRWPHFSPEEVLSPDGLKQLKLGFLMINPMILDKVEELRECFGPLKCNFDGHVHRGYRSAKENALIPGAEEFSYHVQGLAMDLTSISKPLVDLHQAAMTLGFHGIGYYPDRNFVHVDLRPRLTNKQVFWTK